MRPNRAALALLNAGIGPSDLATELGVTRQAVSFQLAGKAAETSTDLLELIARLGGRELADQIADIIETDRHRHRALVRDEES